MSSVRVVFDLNKANKNLTNLVQVQRMVTRNGKTFTQNFWVLPSQVKSTDRVLSTQQQGSGSAFDLSKFDNLKNTNRDDAIKYLESCGITWNKSPHAGINWMRACMAAKKAAGKPVQQGGKPKAQPTAPVTPQGVSQTVTGKTYDLSSLSGTFDTLSGKDKVNALKTIISKDDMFAFAKNAGVTWDEHQHAGINNMRMQMALAAWADSHSLADCKAFAVIKTGGSPALAKMPNKKDTSATANKDNKKDKPEPKKPDDKLTVPANASQRQKDLIEMINKVSSKSDLDMYKSLGMIAEDDQAKAYLEKTLLPNVLNAAANSSSAPYHGYANNGTVVEGLNKTMKGFGARLIKHGAFETLCHSLDSRIFTAPRDCLEFGQYDGKGSINLLREAQDTGNVNSVGGPSSMKVYSLLDSLRENFGEYIPGSDNIGKAAGYQMTYHSEFDPDIAKKSFDPDKDGVCVALSIIAENQPELKDTAESMKKSYLDLIELSGNDLSTLLDRVVRYPDAQLSEERETSKKLVEYSNFMKEVLKNGAFKGDSDTYNAWLDQQSDWGGRVSIAYSNRDHVTVTLRNKDFDYRKPTDDTNWRTKEYSVDLQDVTLSNGQNAKDYFSSITPVSQISIFKSESTEKQMRRNAESDLFTPETKEKALKLVCDMFGMEFKDYTYKDRYGGNVNTKLFAPKDDSKRDAVMTNLIHMNNMVESKNTMASTLQNNYTASKLNDNGDALENVFDYINTSRFYVDPVKQQTELGIYQYSTKKLSQKDWLEHLKKQHRQTKVYSSQELQDVKNNLLKFNEARFSQFPAGRYGGWSNPNYAYLGGYGSGLDVYRNSLDNKTDRLAPEHPLFNIMVDDLSSVVINNPASKNARVKTDDDVIKVLKGNLGISTKVGDDGNEITKALRESALKAIKCSLSTLPDNDYKDLQHKVKVDWDQVVHGNNSAVFHGAYEIKNLEHEEKFNAACQRMNEKPQRFYHGTSFEGTQGILGNTGHFRVPKNQKQVKAGSMLGYGIYLASKSSKSAQYFRGYNNGRYGCGSLLICDAILGKQMPYVGTSSSPSYDTSDGTVCATTAMNSRYHLMNDEWAVRNEDFVMPRILVDMENARRK